ncbi:hypothetical protein HO173_002053 [Letharia columbiana]|uniref:Uncharacterized protein n=1 Tax=Letharia columbiana TaxID=112416 RepID=A0A8H6G361_9LECA|nr:uncharacterized protein HO173_002053 [Letharia columbiana]KAF6239509.1 hypothetical protein HO173_002053 [Letharia columbiana]
MLQQPQYFPSQQYAHTQTQPIQPHLPSPIKLPSRLGIADRSPSKAPQLPSSPVRVEGDAGELRRAYFAWQIQRNPSEEAAFADALEKIEVESYTLKQIRRMSPSDWKEIEVSRGMAIRLKDEVKDFVEVLRLRAATSAAGFASRRPHTALDALAAAALLENEVIDEDSDEEGEEGEEEA